MSGRGRFIAFEGGEGTGKSTQARLLAAALAAKGIACLTTREPGGTPGAEAIRALLLDPALPQWDAPAEALLFAAARSDHVARLIEPALAAGRWVICDRFVDSSLAYQGGAGGLGETAIRTLHQIGSGGLLPDVTLLLDADPRTTSARILARDGSAADKIGGRGMVFHRDVAAAFDRLTEAEPARFRRIDASGGPGAVHALVLDALSDLLQ
ncbi:dTMP kinase [Novosphingobium sp. Gsoil 351]|uniref:dTMP kinase n=1 Tax=Novosphingobium sp. Gsoil 351 TaxID=2675225 RepID=UPI0012B4EE2B|nr:dTMP kinase [Novosphingobium sp. Gsoil 351]QGN53344.1 dTMP kinase [Novosphingobium sp. Gsoil 351]